MGGSNLIGSLVKQSGIYGKSLVFFLILVLAVGSFVLFRPLQAEGPVDLFGQNDQDANAYQIDMTEQGDFFVGNSKLDVEKVINSQTYLYRYQIVNHPDHFIDSLQITLKLPKPGSEAIIGHQLVSNGGALSVESQLVDQRTIVYQASEISPQAQLSLEIEVPKNYIHKSLAFYLQERLQSLSPAVWTVVSIGLPALTVLILLVVAVSRTRRVSVSPEGVLTDPPSRLSPALLGILLKGKITNRDLAATLIDLARRNHLVIRQVSVGDFRFSRKSSADKLEAFEQALLDQIFGPVSEQTNAEEITFAIAQELFSKQISEAFMLAYQKINDLGYFYTNPLRLHRRYQIIGMLLFALGLAGFFINLLIFSGYTFVLFFWVGMLVSALLISLFAKGLPSRSVLADRELSRWLAFREYLHSSEPINYTAHTQEKYLAYLPYAIVFEVEVEWTRRFYDLPFNQPGWYVAANISTIDEFANKIFPLFGYLSHLLAISVQPASR